jgi:hypothetical protein
MLYAAASLGQMRQPMMWTSVDLTPRRVLVGQERAMHVGYPALHNGLTLRSWICLSNSDIIGSGMRHAAPTVGIRPRHRARPDVRFRFATVGRLRERTHDSPQAAVEAS